MKVYKIYDEETNEFRHAGSYPRYSKTGKTWEKKGHLTNAINNFGESDDELKTVYVIEGEFVITNKIPILEYVKEARERKDERERKSHEWIEKTDKKRKFEEYLKLKQELGL